MDFGAAYDNYNASTGLELQASPTLTTTIEMRAPTVTLGWPTVDCDTAISGLLIAYLD